LVAVIAVDDIRFNRQGATGFFAGLGPARRKFQDVGCQCTLLILTAQLGLRIIFAYKFCRHGALTSLFMSPQTDIVGRRYTLRVLASNTSMQNKMPSWSPLLFCKQSFSENYFGGDDTRE
jgi:hypothetical protein